MVAKIAGFITRKQAGLLNPTSISRNITPANGGGVVHWGGTRQSIGSHARCLEIWRGWQNYHMRTHGWADLAYTGGFCNHGFAFAGRGFFTRTAANGTNVGNQNYYAYVWIGGQGEVASVAAIDALDWWIAEGRRAGNAGRRVRPHEDFTGSTCPGPQLKTIARSRDNKNITIGGTTTPTGDDNVRASLEKILEGMTDAQAKLLVDTVKQLSTISDADGGPAKPGSLAWLVRASRKPISELGRPSS